jgi:hypothetical protein
MLIYIWLCFYYIYKTYTTLFFCSSLAKRGEFATKHHIIKIQAFVTLAVCGVNDHLLCLLYTLLRGTQNGCGPTTPIQASYSVYPVGNLSVHWLCVFVGILCYLYKIHEPHLILGN